MATGAPQMRSCKAPVQPTRRVFFNMRDRQWHSARQESRMKYYSGDRTIDGVKVTVDGGPLDPCTDLVAFTQNGFEWSYEGPEPRQLALALLVDHLGDRDRAKTLVEPFMRAIVANFDNEWEMNSADLDSVLGALAGRAVA
jgi:Family of unknown function (DUF6166)